MTLRPEAALPDYWNDEEVWSYLTQQQILDDPANWPVTEEQWGQVASFGWAGNVEDFVPELHELQEYQKERLDDELWESYLHAMNLLRIISSRIIFDRSDIGNMLETDTSYNGYRKILNDEPLRRDNTELLEDDIWNAFIRQHMALRLYGGNDRRPPLVA